jgi:hypothetical protein
MQPLVSFNRKTDSTAMTNSTLQVTKRKSAGLLGLLVAAVLTGCFTSENPAEVGSGEEVAVRVRMGVGSVTALHKSNVIKMDKLILVYTSSANDTIRDTITGATSPSLDSVSTTPQTIVKNRTLTALRTWKIVVTSKDRLDTVIHRDSATIPAMYAGDTAVVNLNMSSRFSMYEARFLTLPDSIQSSTPAQPKQVLCIDRLVLKVDAVTVRDSTSAGPCFTAGQTHVLAYDYVLVGSRAVQMIAYGPMNYYNDSLYSGSTTINVGAGNDSTVALNLSWVGPTTGVGQLDVELGRVGTVIVNGTLPGTVFP